MTKRATWPPATLVALLLAAGASRAGYQQLNGVGWLGTGDWQLRQSKGEVYLVKSPATTETVHTRWTASAPAIETFADGRDQKLGYEAKGRDRKVRLVKDDKDPKGPSTRWAFEVVGRFKPREWYHKQARERVKDGDEGLTFRAMATEGPCKGWYLATIDDGKGRKRLVLVREKWNATVFKYVGRHYRVQQHK